tara:strand:+ start:1009 stop:1542 length:534 start_codon:yes stop_codon:yes gene_type:complete
MATLIRTARLTETSLIVHWCSEQRGLVKTVAKGALRPKSPFSGKLDLFFEAELVYIPSRTSDLHTLKEVSVVNPRKQIRLSYESTLAAACFIRWVEVVSEPEAPIPETADLLRRALNYLDEKGADMKAILHFEKQLATFSGVYSGRKTAADDLGEAFGTKPVQREELFRKIQSKLHN